MAQHLGLSYVYAVQPDQDLGARPEQLELKGLTAQLRQDLHEAVLILDSDRTSPLIRIEPPLLTKTEPPAPVLFF
jgi:hypothetical protein